MLMPRLFGENLFDDWFDFPMMRDMDRTEKKLYGRHADRLMKTDIREHDDHFELDMDLPGFTKDEITLELSNGYLTVQAAKSLDQDTNGEKGSLIRQERYAGAMQRSFYVGENIAEEDIGASFKDGVLSLKIRKKDAPRVPEKKTIMIEG